MSPQALTFLHLSDLQFGKHHLFAPEGAEGDAAHDTLFGRLSIDLDMLRVDHGLSPDVVLLTGDLAEWGKAKEFEQVQAFAEKLQGLLGLDRRRILVIPGNHDVNRDACQAYFSNYKAEADDGGDPLPPYWDKWRFFHRFFVKFYQGIDQYGFSEDQPWTLFELPELRLVVAGLNSTMKESHREGDHYGWVGEEQLRWFENRLQSKLGWFRMAAVHHNVVRNVVGDDENLRDADDMKRDTAGQRRGRRSGTCVERAGWGAGREPGRTHGRGQERGVVG